MKLHPTKLELLRPDLLLIQWSDGQQRQYSAAKLRDACPCATCREQQGPPEEPPPLLPVIPLEEAGTITIGGMRPIGNYAYSIVFSDGHDTGIYNLELLRQLGEEMA